MNATWREMRSDDLDDIIAIAAEVHPGYPERDEVLAEKFRLYPKGCFLLEADGMVLGYALSHPYFYGEMPKLDMLMGALPVPANCYYLHDVALRDTARGHGAASALMALLLDRARAEGHDRLCLCAVNASAPFWTRQGFGEVALPQLAASLESYGADARYMVRTI